MNERAQALRARLRKFDTHQPRKPDGEWGTGGFKPKTAAPTTPAATPDPGYVSAAKTTAADWTPAELANVLAKETGFGHDFHQGGGDARLLEMWKLQGFTGPPAVLPAAEYDKQAVGRTQLFRGIGGYTKKDAQDHTAQWRGAGDPFPGLGLWGDGTYASTSQKWAKQFASGAMADNEDGIVTQMMIRQDAKVITMRELPGVMGDTVTGKVFDAVDDDPGKIASLFGYDVLDVNIPEGGAEQFIILNRTAIIIRDDDTLSP